MNLVKVNRAPVAYGRFFNDDFVRDIFTASPFYNARRRQAWVPAVNVKETDEAFTLTFALPGITRENLAINLEADTLKVAYAVEKTEDNAAQKAEFVRSFTRSFSLPESVNAEAIAAQYTDGVLTVTLPKREVAAPATRSISVA